MLELSSQNWREDVKVLLNIKKACLLFFVCLFFLKCPFKKIEWVTSFVIWWLRIYPAMQRMQVQPLVREIRPYMLTTEPSHSKAPAPQLEKSLHAAEKPWCSRKFNRMEDPQAPLSTESPGKHTGVSCHFLLQGIFLTQGSNPGLLHCKQILPFEPPGKPIGIGIPSKIQSYMRTYSFLWKGNSIKTGGNAN